jgi:hypothetical protein
MLVDWLFQLWDRVSIIYLLLLLVRLTCLPLSRTFANGREWHPAVGAGLGSRTSSRLAEMSGEINRDMGQTHTRTGILVLQPKAPAHANHHEQRMLGSEHRRRWGTEFTAGVVPLAVSVCTPADIGPSDHGYISL